MSSSSILSVHLPDDVVSKVDRIVFERRLAKKPGRAASRSSVIADLLKAATVNPVANQKDENQ